MMDSITSETEASSTADQQLSRDVIIESAHKRLWGHFQHTAACVTRVFRESNSNSHSHLSHHGHGQGDIHQWPSFQLSAEALTQFYKAAFEEIKVVYDSAYVAGKQKHRNEMLLWTKSQNRHKRSVRKDELISLLLDSNQAPYGSSDDTTNPNQIQIANGFNGFNSFNFPINNVNVVSATASNVSDCAMNTCNPSGTNHASLKRPRTLSTGEQDFLDEDFSFIMKKPRT